MLGNAVSSWPETWALEYKPHSVPTSPCRCIHTHWSIHFGNYNYQCKEFQNTFITSMTSSTKPNCWCMLPSSLNIKNKFIPSVEINYTRLCSREHLLFYLWLYELTYAPATVLYIQLPGGIVKFAFGSGCKSWYRCMGVLLCYNQEEQNVITSWIFKLMFASRVNKILQESICKLSNTNVDRSQTTLNKGSGFFYVCFYYNLLSPLKVVLKSWIREVAEGTLSFSVD